MFALIGPLSHHHRTVTDTRHPQQRVLDLTNLDPETTDLQLRIPPAQKLQLAVRPPPTMITTAIQPPTRTVRIGQERRPGPFRIINVAAANTHPGENDLTRRTQRHQSQMLINHLNVHIVNRATQQHPVGRRPVHHLVVGVIGGLGQPIRIDQLDPGL